MSDLSFENLKKITNYKGPLFIIHAEMDHIIPLDEAMKIHSESLSKNKDIWIIKDANHNNILMHTQQIYFKKIKMFIDSI